MHSTRKIIHAFLASPGDLQEERKVIKDMVKEFNETWADSLGYQVELMGWEETVSGVGRPQKIINQELDRCDLFIGMIWKRWGTPPDHSGKFSSGFEEEFERSMERCDKTGHPEISLFFKQIPEEFMSDPGNDLKKVIEFRDKVIAGKKLLFQNFSTVQDIEKLTRKCISKYVNSVRTQEELSDPGEFKAKRTQSCSEKKVEEGRREKLSSPSTEWLAFLEGFVERIKQTNSIESLNACDVARFRLLANSISKQGNQERNLGVHDINILFAARIEGMRLSSREKLSLTCLGFQHLANENVPLWCWYYDLTQSKPNPAILSSYIGTNENEKVGAISVMTALSLDIPIDDNLYQRDKIIDVWFSVESSAKVRVAALRYLAQCGTKGDLEIAKKEYERNDYSTSRSALECMAKILLRTGNMKAVQKLILESQFESLNADLLEPVLDVFDSLETHSLFLGLEHSNFHVRLHAMKILHKCGALDISMAERLSADSNVLVRREAITVLTELGKPLTDEEVKKILVPHQKQAIDGIEEHLYNQYQLDVLKKLSEEELDRRVKESLVYNDSAYFALMERYFSNRANELRYDVDNRFSVYFKKRIQKTLTHLGVNAEIQKIVKDIGKQKEFLCKRLTRQGLNVLCAAQKSEDLQRIRSNLRDNYTGASKFDAEYLGRHGEWTDILLLANAERSMIDISLHSISDDKEFQVEVAKTIISIGKKYSISDLLSLDIPAVILKNTIELCAVSQFARLSQDVLLNLFNHNAVEVRKAAVIMAVRAFPAKQLKMILRKYVLNEKYRYYNVIHWLDLGASMRRDEAKKVARMASS